MGPIHREQYDKLLIQVVENKSFPKGFEITTKTFQAYSCHLESEEVDFYIYHERYFGPLEINLYLKKWNFRYEFFALLEAFLTEKSSVKQHIYQDELSILASNAIKARFWLKNPIQSFTDLKQVLNLIFDLFITEAIPILQIHGGSIEGRRTEYYINKMDASKVLRDNPEYSAALNIIYKKRTPSVFELIHREILTNVASQANHLTQNDEAYYRAFEKTFNLELPIEYKNLILSGQKHPYLLDLPQTVIEVQNFSFTYFLDLHAAFDEKEEYPKHIKGALRIADYGCGISYLLILNGKEKGNIWVDDRANQDKIFPYLTQDKQRANLKMWAMDNGLNC